MSIARSGRDCALAPIGALLAGAGSLQWIAGLANTPHQYQSVIDLAYELMPHARLRQANRIAQALAIAAGCRPGAP